ncbi:MAG: hypothetical protein ACYCYI_10595 [Saccharofermentanales bacterium]
MAEQNYLDKILETESIAEKIEFIARSERKERISIAREEAKNIIITTKNDADIRYKETIASMKDESVRRLEEDKQNALSEAQKLRDIANGNKEATIKKIAERIVKYCADN